MVGQHPVPADALELGVQARDLGVRAKARSHATSRPIVRRPPAGSAWMTCASSRRKTRNGVPARSASSCALSSAGVERCIVGADTQVSKVDT